MSNSSEISMDVTPVEEKVTPIEQNNSKIGKFGKFFSKGLSKLKKSNLETSSLVENFFQCIPTDEENILPVTIPLKLQIDTSTIYNQETVEQYFLSRCNLTFLRLFLNMIQMQLLIIYFII